MGNKNDKIRAAARYSAIGTELMVVLALAVWGGIKLDAWLGTKVVFIILLPMLGLGAVLYQVINMLNDDKKADKS